MRSFLTVSLLNTGINRFVNYYVTIDDDYQFVQITARKSSNLLILQGAGQLKDLSSWIVNGYNSNFDKKSYSGVLGTINASGNYLKLPEATISGKSINGAVMMPNWLIHFPGSSTESKITTNSQLIWHMLMPDIISAGWRMSLQYQTIVSLR